jgi:hypothetical protein
MAAIDDSIGGFGHFERGGLNRLMGCINGDPSRHGDRVDSGWGLLFDRGRLDVMASFNGAVGRRYGQGGGFDSQSD